MSVFNYIAYDKNGKERKGVLEGDTPKKIRQQLREQGLTPIGVSTVSKSLKIKHQKKKGGWQKRFNINDLALLTRELASLLASGMPVEEALLAVSEQNEKPHIKRIILAVRSKVMEGYSLAVGLNDYPEVFPEVYRATVASGEQSGHLDAVLNHLANYTEQQQHMRQKIRQALVYPALMTAVSIAIVAFLLVVVVPKMIDVFQDTGQQLPILTRLLLGLSESLQVYGLYLAGGIFLLGYALRYSLKKPKLRKSFHRFLFLLPIFGKSIKTVNTARFARTLGILCSSGVPILDAMRISSELISNLPMKEAVQEVIHKVREGTAIHHALKKTGYFQPVTLHFIANGEKSGNLEEMLHRAAENQERHVSMLLETTLSLFEPLLILLMGGIVLFIVLAILLPMFEMTQMIG